MTPATQALAYRIWAYCEPREWDCTNAEVAEALGEDARRVAGVIRWRGWASRLRPTPTRPFGVKAHLYYDTHLIGQGSREAAQHYHRFGAAE